MAKLKAKICQDTRYRATVPQIQPGDIDKILYED